MNESSLILLGKKKLLTLTCISYYLVTNIFNVNAEFPCATCPLMRLFTGLGTYLRALLPHQES